MTFCDCDHPVRRWAIGIIFLLMAAFILTGVHHLDLLTSSSPVFFVKMQGAMSSGLSSSRIRNGTLTPDSDVTSDWVSLWRARALELGRSLLLIYNRVPKCGSRAVLKVINMLKKRNAYSVRHSVRYHYFLVSETEKIRLEKNLSRIPRPAIFDRHMYFMEFDELKLNGTLFLNVVREPVSHFVSLFYFLRTASMYRKRMFTKEERNMTLDECIAWQHPSCKGHKPHIIFTIPFFCGNQAFCRIPGAASLARAQQNVDRYYSLVGITEDLYSFFTAAEHIFPVFFQGAPQIFQEISNKTSKHYRTNQRVEPQSSTIEILKNKLQYEMDFYSFVKKRFYTGTRGLLIQQVTLPDT